MHPDATFDDADLNGFVDGRIDPARGSALAESLASDPTARARVEAWRRQSETLRTMFAAVLAEPVPVRLRPVAVPPRVPAPAPRSGRGISGALASTSVGMAFVGFTLGVLASIGADGLGLVPAALRAPGPAAGRAVPAASDARALATRAAEAHRTFLGDAPFPAELSAAEEPRLERWLRQRLGGAPRLPDLARQGWSFLNARIVPGRRGPAAFLTYGDGADRLGLYVSRGAGDGRAGPVDDGDRPLGVATWDDGGFGFGLTSDRGQDWLKRNVGALREGARTPPAAADLNPPSR